MSAPGRDPAANILQGLDIRQPSQHARIRRLDEPATERPQETPPSVYRPKDDPFEREKDKRYKVDLFEMLKVKTAVDPEDTSILSTHAVNYLLFDNYFDHLCSDRLKAYGVPQLDGQEQAMYFCFYRFSYGFGYSACPMSRARIAVREKSYRQRSRVSHVSPSPPASLPCLSPSRDCAKLSPRNSRRPGPISRGHSLRDPRLDSRVHCLEHYPRR